MGSIPITGSNPFSWLQVAISGPPLLRAAPELEVIQQPPHSAAPVASSTVLPHQRNLSVDPACDAIADAMQRLRVLGMAAVRAHVDRLADQEIHLRRAWYRGHADGAIRDPGGSSVRYRRIEFVSTRRFRRQRHATA